MPVRIRRLQCNVSLRSGGKETVTHQDQNLGRPSMEFARPMPQQRSEQTLQEPSQTFSEANASSNHAEGEKPANSALQADARAVADRVYVLMQQEIALARLRGGAKRQR